MKRIVIALVIALSVTPAYANDVRSGNGSINPDTGAQLQADYQIVITDANGTVISVSKDMPTTVPSGANIWSNNGSWGDVKVGGMIKNGSSGNLYAPPGVTIPVEPVKVVVPVVTPDTTTVFSNTVNQPQITTQTPTQVLPQSPTTDTATVTTKIDTATVVIETATAVVDTPTATSILDEELNLTWDWDKILAWIVAWFDKIWIKL